MEQSSALLQTLTIAIVAGILSQVIAEKIRIPSIAILMPFGIILGPEVLGLVQPKYLGDGFEVLIALAVALILFEGGLSIDLKAFKEVNRAVINLSIICMPLTIFGSAAVAHYLIGLSWVFSFLFGSFIARIGPTVVIPILQRVKIKKEIATISISESILTSTFGTFVSVAILDIILAPKQSLGYFCFVTSLKIIVSSLVGYGMGWLLRKYLRRKQISSDLKNLVVLAWVFGTYLLTDMIEEHTGILSVVMCGFALQKEDIPQLHTLKRFKGQLSILSISILFILLSANLDLGQVANVGYKGILIIFSIIFVVRPIGVFVSTLGLLKFKEQVFISWMGPKGITAASITALLCLILDKHNVEEAALIQSLVFLTVIATVILQSISARRVAKLCNLIEERNNIVIIGANALGRTLGTAFTEIGKDVTLIDNNFEHCRDSVIDELGTIHGNCLDPSILELAQINSASIVIATTSNSEVNFLVCQMAKEVYNVPFVYPAIDSPDKGVHHRLVEEIGGNLAYAKTVSIEDWKMAISQNLVKIMEWELTDSKGGMLYSLKPNDIPYDDWLPLILKRGNVYFFAHSDQVWSTGDILICLSKST